MNPTSISGGRDGEMGRWGNMEETNRKKVTNFIGILGFPDSEMFLPRPALCDSVSFFFVLEKIKGFKYRARGDNRTFQRTVLDEYCTYVHVSSGGVAC